MDLTMVTVIMHFLFDSKASTALISWPIDLKQQLVQDSEMNEWTMVLSLKAHNVTYPAAKAQL